METQGLIRPSAARCLQGTESGPVIACFPCSVRWMTQRKAHIGVLYELQTTWRSLRGQGFQKNKAPPCGGRSCGRAIASGPVQAGQGRRPRSELRSLGEFCKHIECRGGQGREPGLLRAAKQESEMLGEKMPAPFADGKGLKQMLAVAKPAIRERQAARGAQPMLADFPGGKFWKRRGQNQLADPASFPEAGRRFLRFARVMPRTLAA